MDRKKMSALAVAVVTGFNAGGAYGQDVPPATVESIVARTGRWARTRRADRRGARRACPRGERRRGRRQWRRRRADERRNRVGSRRAAQHAAQRTAERPPTHARLYQRGRLPHCRIPRAAGPADGQGRQPLLQRALPLVHRRCAQRGGRHRHRREDRRERHRHQRAGSRHRQRHRHRRSGELRLHRGPFRLGQPTATGTARMSPGSSRRRRMAPACTASPTTPRSSTSRWATAPSPRPTRSSPT